MALTLDATLSTAQDSQSRHPICEIISAQNSDDIPFDGERLTGEDIREFSPNTISHSSGRLCLVYLYTPKSGNGSRGIKYVYTDIERTVFTTVTTELFTTTANYMYSVSLCELTNGNIGITYIYYTGTNYYLVSKIVEIDGTLVASSIKAIGNWVKTIHTSDAWVQTIAENSYLMIYGKQSGSDYFFYKRTSADFLTWSAESALSIGGIDTTYKLDRPSIVELDSGELWLWFDALEDTSVTGDEIYNAYYSISSDNGSTWGNAVKFTNYTAFGQQAQHPVAVQKTATSMHVIFTKIVKIMFMNSSFEGWPGISYSNDISELSWDSVNRKLYLIAYRSIAKSARIYFACVIKIDVDTWTVDTYWDDTTVPAFSTDITDTSYIRRDGGYAVHEGYHIVAYGGRFIDLLDGEANTIIHYDLTPTTGNVSGVPAVAYQIGKPYVDFAHDKIWLTFSDGASNAALIIGYLDLTEESDYEWHQFYSDTNTGATEYVFSSWESSGGYVIDYTYNMLIFTTGFTGSGDPTQVGACLAIDLSTGAIVWENETADNVIYYAPLVYNGKIYCGKGVQRETGTTLAEIDVLTGEENEITLHYIDESPGNIGRPVYVSGDKILFVHEPYGIILFDTVTRDYEIFSNDTIFPFTKDGINPNWLSPLVYDSTNGLVFFGHHASTTYPGLYAFSINGYIYQANYSVGSYAVGAWTFSEPATLIQGLYDYNAVAVVEPGSESSMYVFWQRIEYSVDGIPYYIKWDKDGSSMEVTNYLVSEVSTEHSINGDPASLSFTLSHGHLFDTYNTNSLLNNVCAKGRKLTLRWGEDIGGVEYWQNAGTFYITETSLSFERGKYPTITIRAEDQRCFWNTGHVYATSIYNQQTPKTVIDGILNSQGGVAEGDRNIPAISTSLINYQGMENTITEMLDHICGRFGYYFRFDVDGKAHAKQISNALTVNHTYTDNTKLLNYTPDDRYSDFTNRVTVRGQSLDFTEITFAEERITNIAGTLGWWGCKADHLVWFSEDKSRRVINPRMVVIETATSIAFELAGQVKEYLEECGDDDDDKFCIIYVEAPNLIPALIAAVALYGAGALIGDIVIVEGFIVSGGMTIPLGRAMEYAALLIIVNILGSVANYNLEVWGNPLGQIRQSYQESADDTAHQTKIGQVIEQVIDEPLCYSVDDCLEVADFELMVVQMQRRRVRIKKIAHLQDEDGDTIRFVHPYSGNNIDLFITNLRRTFKRGKDGYFYDEIEGWVC